MMRNGSAATGKRVVAGRGCFLSYSPLSSCKSEAQIKLNELVMVREQFLHITHCTQSVR